MLIPGDCRNCLLYYNKNSQYPDAANARNECGDDDDGEESATVEEKDKWKRKKKTKWKSSFSWLPLILAFEIWQHIAISECSESPDRDCCEPLYPFFSLSTNTDSSITTARNMVQNIGPTDETKGNHN